MFKGVSQNAQHAREVIRLSDMASGEEVLSINQQRDSLKSAVWAVDEQIAALPKKSPARKALGLRKQELCQQLAQMPRNAMPPTYVHYFKNAAHEILAKPIYEAICQRAIRLAKEEGWLIQPEPEATTPHSGAGE